ncbi:MAG: sigma-54 dependent transcriptional regulator [Byssovorax sp.]
MAVTSEARPSVLVVDDDLALGKVVTALLAQDGIDARCVRSGAAALDSLAERPADAVITDLRMPGMDGMELLGKIVAEHPGTPVIMFTAHGTVPLAVEAMKRGAAEFVLKPFAREELLFVVHKVLAGAAHAEERPPERAPAEGRNTCASAAMRECQSLVTRAAAGTATVLLRGESGTGKEVAARSIHEQSPRRKGPFVRVHCAALPDALLESELFGYEKGAFTGAVQRKPGRVELSQGGTLFLDEIGDTTLSVQVKLLRLLQEKEYERLGGVETLKADVRFVAATNRDLEAMIQAGTFREDLFYRLSVVPIGLPPLRDRPEDIAPLAKRFCAELGAANGRPGAALDAGAIAVLETQSWPGNVRQLQNFIERLVVLAEGDALGAGEVQRELARKLPGSPPASKSESGTESGSRLLEDSRRDAERAALQTALTQSKGNRTLAARLLGISRRTLYNKLEELKLI